MPQDIKRQRSKSEGLVKKTIGFARAYSDNDLNRTELSLEAEIRRESVVPPRHKKVARFRLKGERLLHSKHVLLGIVILNLIDCALVLGELILDIHFIRELRNKSDASAQLFIDTLQGKYPDHLKEHNIDNMDALYAQLYLAQCKWSNGTSYMLKHTGNRNGPVYNTHAQNGKKEWQFMEETPVQEINVPSATKRSVQRQGDSQRINDMNNLNSNFRNQNYSDRKRRLNKNNSTQTNSGDHLDSSYHYGTWNNSEHHNETLHLEHVSGHHHHEHSVWEHVAHGLHKTSITILGILFIENFLKMVFMGRTFLTKKLEVFDALVVFISFVIDLVFLKGLMRFKVQDAVFILTFLLPWRVIRVVNSLIVAVLDHEHFRLKMLYQEKKVVTAELKLLKAKEKGWDFHLKKIEHFCESEGIPKWKIRQHTAMGRKQSTITSMASLALNGILKGMVLSPSDKMLLDKSISLSTQDSTCSNLTVISESDDTDDTLTGVSVLTNQSSVTDGASFYMTSDESENNTDSSKRKVSIVRENGARHEINAEIENTHAQPETSIVKTASKATIKSVTFDPKESKPLLHRQDSFDVNDQKESIDDSDSEE